MGIRFISSMTPEDEARLAPSLIDLIGTVLDQMPIVYTLVIDTGVGTFQRTHAPSGSYKAPTTEPKLKP